VEAFLLAAANEKADGQVFNIGGDRVIALKDLAALLIEVNGSGRYEIRAYPAARKRIDIGDYHADFSKAREMIGWRPTTALGEALKRTLGFYREHLHQYR
jgi:UDP-glucose 4-epimerase